MPHAQALLSQVRVFICGDWGRLRGYAVLLECCEVRQSSVGAPVQLGMYVVYQYDNKHRKQNTPNTSLT